MRRPSLALLLRTGFLGALAASAAPTACGGADSASSGGLSCPAFYDASVGSHPVPPDGASLCPPGPCNYQTQAGCGANEACTIHLDTKTGTAVPACRAAGTRKRGESCDEKSFCAAGLVCASGTCRTLCCGGDWTACAAGESCIRQAKVLLRTSDGGVVREADGGAEEVDTGVGICVPVNDCDIFDENSCSATPERPVCRIADARANVACQPASASRAGDPCSETEPCGPLLVCNGKGGAGTCRKICRAEACGTPACSDQDGVCVHFDRDPPGVGECTPGYRPGPGDAGSPG
jgi:hypothetical protein